jgi:ribosomal protein L28
MSGLAWRAAKPALAIAVIGSAIVLAASGHALEELRGEEAAIKACDKRLCAILIQKEAKGEDLRCKLTKTWARSSIKQAESHKLSWGFGDARCTVEVNLSRASLVAMITGEKRKLRLSPHTVNCVVEQEGKLEKVTATVAPKIEFKDGKAEKIWINLKEVDGPAGIKATIVTASELADKLGLFHRRMIKQINRYIERRCPENHPELVTASARKAPQSKPEKK